jgi:hypothetical protein
MEDEEKNKKNWDDLKFFFKKNDLKKKSALIGCDIIVN